MIIVADTSPLNYLVRIGHIEVLRALYQQIAIPSGVLVELQRDKAPEEVRVWANNLPEWVVLHRDISVPFKVSGALDGGEREAIALALQVHAPAVIIDETEGRAEAQRHGLRVIGTLGILRDAAAIGLIDLDAALYRLAGTNFKVAPELLARIRQR
jgi:predicted nucleic acid-binding protein